MPALTYTSNPLSQLLHLCLSASSPDARMVEEDSQWRVVKKTNWIILISALFIVMLFLKIGFVNPTILFQTSIIFWHYNCHLCICNWPKKWSSSSNVSFTYNRNADLRALLKQFTRRTETRLHFLQNGKHKWFLSGKLNTKFVLVLVAKLLTS